MSSNHQIQRLKNDLLRGETDLRSLEDGLARLEATRAALEARIVEYANPGLHLTLSTVAQVENSMPSSGVIPDGQRAVRRAPRDFGERTPAFADLGPGQAS